MRRKGTKYWLCIDPKNTKGLCRDRYLRRLPLLYFSTPWTKISFNYPLWILQTLSLSELINRLRAVLGQNPIIFFLKIAEPWCIGTAQQRTCRWRLVSLQHREFRRLFTWLGHLPWGWLISVSPGASDLWIHKGSHHQLTEWGVYLSNFTKSTDSSLKRY